MGGKPDIDDRRWSRGEDGGDEHHGGRPSYGAASGPERGTVAGDTEGDGRRKLDLSVPQVAASAIAAVAAAKLASNAGVYGTILGAGLVSVVVTCGGPVLQHLFARTGERLRGGAVPPGPDRSPDVPHGTPAWDVPPLGAPVPGEYGEATVHRARVRSWKRPLIGAALVFGVTMGGITTYELASGESFGGGGGTTLGEAVTGGGGASRPDRPEGPGRTDPGPDGETSPDPGRQDGRDPAPDGTADDASPDAEGGAQERPDGESPAVPSPSPSREPGPGTGQGTGPEDASGTPVPEATAPTGPPPAPSGTVPAPEGSRAAVEPAP
ncbi:hypothetical protein JNUCC64_07190 [Streptomyces sp. JNUCC 64]